MSQVNELKKALENLSSKEHVISKEATFAKESIQESYLKDYETVKERVLIDFQQETRRAANEQYFLDLRNKYSVDLPN